MKFILIVALLGLCHVNSLPTEETLKSIEGDSDFDQVLPKGRSGKKKRLKKNFVTLSWITFVLSKQSPLEFTPLKSIREMVDKAKFQNFVINKSVFKSSKNIITLITF